MAQPSAPPTEDEDELELPPLQFPGIEAVLDAIALDTVTAELVDRFWQPAIAALVAANPQRAEAARAFATARRDRELAAYRPAVSYMLDQRVVQLLDPGGARRLKVVEDKMLPGAADRLRALEVRAARIRAEAAPGVTADLVKLAALALTPDGIALRELNRKALFYCMLEKRRWSPPEDDKHCATLEDSPALKRLRATRSGEQLVQLSTHAHLTLHATMAMAHAAGFSLFWLLPPDQLRAAGLDVPADRSLDEHLLGPETPATPQ